MSNQLRFPLPPPPGPSQRAARRRLPPSGQLDLFANDPRKVVPLPVSERPFDLAFRLDVEGDEHALDLYREAAEQGDRPADAHCNIGVWHARSGDTEAATRSFCQALASDPAHLLSHYNLGNLYLSLEHADLARVHYQRCLQIDSSFPGAYLNLAWIHAVQGESGEALEALHRFRALVTREEARAADPLLEWLRGGGQRQEGALLPAADQAEIRRMVERLQELRGRFHPVPHDTLRPGQLRLLEAAIASLGRLAGD
ncbi:MAG: hypothetical protein AB1505_12475 [Candidatus Latescibacterota bacterium]